MVCVSVGRGLAFGGDTVFSQVLYQLLLILSFRVHVKLSIVSYRIVLFSFWHCSSFWHTWKFWTFFTWHCLAAPDFGMHGRVVGMNQVKSSLLFRLQYENATSYGGP